MGRLNRIGGALRGRTNSFFAHLRSLSVGDKTIAGVLFAVLVFLLLVALYQLERQFLVEVPSEGGVLVEGAVKSPRFVHPLLAISDADHDLAALTYAGLMGYDKNGVLVPVIASSYEVSEDKKEYTFHLKETVVFSDGSPVTAEDVVFTIEKAQDPSLKSPRLADFAGIEVVAVDAFTVRFILKEPYAPFLEEMTIGILPSRLWKEVTNEEFPFSKYTGEPVGAGPFIVSRVVRNKEGEIKRYELKGNPRYALGAPYLREISFVYFEGEEELSEALRRGRVESAYGVISDSAIIQPYSRVFGAFFNQTKNPALAHLSVRKALSYAIDRQALVTHALSGYAAPITGPLPADITAIFDSEGGAEKAIQLLEEDGWELNEEGVWVHEKESSPLSVTLTTANVPELKAVADTLKNNWATIHVPAEIKLYEPNDLVLSAIRPREYEALLYGMVIGRDRDLFAFWDSSQRNDPGLNVSLYANRAVDELLEEIRAIEDEEEALKALQTLEEVIAQEYPAVFTHSPLFVYSIPKTLKGVVIRDAASPSDRFITAPFWHKHTEYVWPFLVSSK